MKVITSFEGEYRFLSNFYPSIIRIPNNDWEYPTVEHYFQAQKARDNVQRRQILEAKTPGHAKRMGRSLGSLRVPDWEDRKVGIMLAGLRYKFRTHERLRNKLMETGDAILVEGNDWGDEFWGQCLREDGFVGYNMLGTLLMMVRQQLHGGFKIRITKT